VVFSFQLRKKNKISLHNGSDRRKIRTQPWRQTNLDKDGLGKPFIKEQTQQTFAHTTGLCGLQTSANFLRGKLGTGECTNLPVPPPVLHGLGLGVQGWGGWKEQHSHAVSNAVSVLRASKATSVSGHRNNPTSWVTMSFSSAPSRSGFGNRSETERNEERDKLRW
jgi:hypothetical protein